MSRRLKHSIMRAEINIEDAEFYIHLSFERAKEEGAKRFDKKKTKIKGKKKPKRPNEDANYALKRIESKRVELLSSFIADMFRDIINSFPETEELPQFYKELLQITVGIDEMKKSLAAVSWSAKRIGALAYEYQRRIFFSNNPEQIKQNKKAFDGRFSSMIRQIDSNLISLREAKKKIIEYPWIKQVYTVAISGFPNVGKSTLLSKMTDAKPEIANYAFTTTSILLGYFSAFDYGGAEKDVQVIDTPGTLSRPDKMNDVEKQAYISMRCAANIIIYIFDPTETYPIEIQEQLLKEVKAFKKETFVYISKTDIRDERTQANAAMIKKKYGAITDIEELKALIKTRAQAECRIKANLLSSGRQSSR